MARRGRAPWQPGFWPDQIRIAYKTSTKHRIPVAWHNQPRGVLPRLLRKLGVDLVGCDVGPSLRQGDQPAHYQREGCNRPVPCSHVSILSQPLEILWLTPALSSATAISDKRCQEGTAWRAAARCQPVEDRPVPRKRDTARFRKRS